MQVRRSTAAKARHRLWQIDHEIAEILRNYPELAEGRPKRSGASIRRRPTERRAVSRRMQPH